MDQLKKYLILIVNGLVTRPDLIEIISKEDEQGLLFTLSVGREDVGKIIGRRGSISEALKTIMRSAGYQMDIRTSLKIFDPLYPQDNDE